MTQALTELLSKVEGGWNGNTEHDFMQLVYKAFGRYDWRVISAFCGDPNPAGGYHPPSLDAARSLHEAVLPGWDGMIHSTGMAQVKKRGVGGVVLSEHLGRIENKPARAWLICILKALISQEGE